MKQNHVTKQFQGFARSCTGLSFVLSAMVIIVQFVPCYLEAESLRRGEARVIQKADGTAQVQFQPRLQRASDVLLYDLNGTQLGSLADEALFEVTVSIKNLKASLSTQGLDLKVLLEGAGMLRELNGKPYVVVDVPYEVQDAKTGDPIKTGRGALIPLSSFIETHDVTPVGVTSKSPGFQPLQRRVEETILNKGVVGEPPRTTPSTPVVTPPPKKTSKAEPTEGWKERYKNADDGFLSPPICGCVESYCKITSKYGKRDNHFHDGTDIAGTTSTEVRAAADGCLVRKTLGYGGGWGNAIFLDHSDGGEQLTTLYAHMSSLSKKAFGVPPVCFKRGEFLGYVGKTGAATGPHLHFGIYRSGKHIPPGPIMVSMGENSFNMSCSDLEQFNEKLLSEKSIQLESVKRRWIGTSEGRDKDGAQTKPVTN